MSLESERGKELAYSLKKNNERLREKTLWTTDGTGQRTTGTRGVLRGPHGPKKNYEAYENIILFKAI